MLTTYVGLCYINYRDTEFIPMLSNVTFNTTVLKRTPIKFFVGYRKSSEQSTFFT